MKPEKETEIILWNWFKTQGTYIKEIYFNNSKNGVGAPSFTTKGISKKPDFILKLERGFGIEYLAIEIKTGDNKTEIYDAGKILDYYFRAYTKQTIYYIEDKEITIHHFAIATKYSLGGSLFLGDIEKVDNSTKDKFCSEMVKLKVLPKIEFVKTHAFVRNLWTQFKRLREKEKIDNESAPSLGIIMAFGEENKTPSLFTINYNKHLSKPKWGQRFWEL